MMRAAVLASVVVVAACKRERHPDAAMEKLVAALRAASDFSGKQATGPRLCPAPEVEKRCTADADCAIVEVILDKRLVDPCADEDCPPCTVRWMFTEDCALSGDAAVRCVEGRCMTHSVAR